MNTITTEELINWYLDPIHERLSSIFDNLEWLKDNITSSDRDMLEREVESTQLDITDMMLEIQIRKENLQDEH